MTDLPHRTDMTYSENIAANGKQSDITDRQNRPAPEVGPGLTTGPAISLPTPPPPPPPRQ